jgi:hypothetical protein
MVPLFSFSVKYEEAVGRVVGWPGLCQGWLGECRRPEREDCSDSEDAHDYRCVYRQLRRERSGDEVRPGWRVN